MPVPHHTANTIIPHSGLMNPENKVGEQKYIFLTASPRSAMGNAVKKREAEEREAEEICLGMGIPEAQVLFLSLVKLTSTLTLF